MCAMQRLLPLVILVGIVFGSSPVPAREAAPATPAAEVPTAPPTPDTPRGAMTLFLLETRDADYADAAELLDLRRLPADERRELGERRRQGAAGGSHD